MLSPSELLDSLKAAPWVVASKTFGNNHATLVGLLVNWWITAAPDTRWAVEGAPSYGYREKGVGGGLCDALLCDRENVLGIIEVEGTRGRCTAEKLGKFFAAEVEYYATLEFAVLLLYAYNAVGRGGSRSLPPAADAPTLLEVVNVSEAYPAKPIVVVTLDKSYERQKQGIRSRNEYYWGSPTTITGFVYQRGVKAATSVFYECSEPRPAAAPDALDAGRRTA